MNDHLKLCCRAISGIAVAAALSVGPTASSGFAQTMQQPYRDSSQANRPPGAMPHRVAESASPCGGDFGMLGNLEAARHGVAQANPTDSPVCYLNGLS